MLAVNELTGFGAGGEREIDQAVYRLETVLAASATTKTFNLPAEAVSGGMLVAIIMGRRQSSGNVTVTEPSGWTMIGQTSLGTANDVYMAAAWKICDGSEGATEDFTIDSGCSAAVYCYFIDQHAGVAPQIAFVQAINPPNLAPSWGSAPNLWITGGIAAAANITGTPTGYGNFDSASLSTGVTSGSAIADKLATASSDDPSTFSSGSTFPATFTCAVKR